MRRSPVFQAYQRLRRATDDLEALTGRSRRGLFAADDAAAAAAGAGVWESLAACAVPTGCIVQDGVVVVCGYAADAAGGLADLDESDDGLEVEGPQAACSSPHGCYVPCAAPQPDDEAARPWLSFLTGLGL